MFDEDLRIHLLERYASRSASRRPEHWLIATAEDRGQQRAWLNRTLGSLLESDRRKIWSRIEDSNHFLQTYHEISVMAILQESGLQPRYEREMDGLTPDLVVCGDQGRPALIIEVVSRMRSSAVTADDRGWRSFSDRVGRIDRPFVVVVRPQARYIGSPDDRAAKRIEGRLRSWLQDDPFLGEMREFGDYWFQITGHMLGTNALLVHPQAGGWVNSDRDVVDVIQGKVKKYAALANIYEVPFVVVLAADPRVPIDLDTVRAAMSGQLRTSINLDPLVRSTTSPPIKMHMKDEPTRWDPALSAVGWLRAGTHEPGTLSLMPCAQATRWHGLCVGGSIEYAS
jgi:hypothetical protein